MQGVQEALSDPKPPEASSPSKKPNMGGGSPDSVSKNVHNMTNVHWVAPAPCGPLHPSP